MPNGKVKNKGKYILLQIDCYHTKRLNIRPYQQIDFHNFLLLLTHPLVKFPLGAHLFLPRPYLLNKYLEQLIQKKATEQRWLLYSIFYKNDKQLIGGCGFKVDREYANAEIFYFLSPKYWGEGLMVEACRPLLDASFSQIGLQNIYAFVILENIRAQRVLEKLAFKYSKVICLNRYSQRKKVQQWALGYLTKII